MIQSLHRFSVLFRKFYDTQPLLVEPVQAFGRTPDGKQLRQPVADETIHTLHISPRAALRRDENTCARGRIEPQDETTEAHPADASLQPDIATVLLVEDEVIVRRMASEILTLSGYRVLEAQHGPEALEIASEHQGRIDLVLIDVIMPLMSGRELAARLQPERPDMRILYMSGYTDDVLTQLGLHDADFAFIQKPFTLDTLAAKVRSILDARQS